VKAGNFGFELIAEPSMLKDELWIIPSRLPYPMGWNEAVLWMRAHSVRIVDLEVEPSPKVKK